MRVSTSGSRAPVQGDRGEHARLRRYMRKGNRGKRMAAHWEGTRWPGERLVAQGWPDLRKNAGDRRMKTRSICSEKSFPTRAHRRSRTEASEARRSPLRGKTGTTAETGDGGGEATPARTNGVGVGRPGRGRASGSRREGGSREKVRVWGWPWLCRSRAPADGRHGAGRCRGGHRPQPRGQGTGEWG